MCKTVDSFREWERITAGVPQRSILGSLLFTIFIINIFLYIENSDLWNHADDSTLYASGKFLFIIIENLIFWKVMIISSKFWIFTVCNPDKCHFKVLGDSNYACNFSCNGETIECNKKENVLGMAIDNNVIFTTHLGNIIKKANPKVDALIRVKCYMGFEQNKWTIPCFIKSQFSYCPLISTFCSRTNQ